MSPIIVLSLTASMFLAWSQPAQYVGRPSAQNGCEYAGKPIWNGQLRAIVPGCDNRIVSPDKRWVLRIDDIRRVMLVVAPNVRLSFRSMQPPGMGSWAPTSQEFFVNDGEGSGETSRLRVFRIRSNRLIEDTTIHDELVEIYRREQKCSATQLDPDVWGLGWSGNGDELYILVQSTIHRPCGPPVQFAVFEVRFSDGAVLRELSAALARKELGSFLPAELRKVE